jgi:hypothetical protein
MRLKLILLLLLVTSLLGCEPAGPDALLLLHFDGSYDGEQGEAGEANGTTFSAGRVGQGVVIDETDTLIYSTAGNLNPGAGAIEFWVRPNHDGNDEEIRVFFEIDYRDHGIQIVTQGGDLRFLMRSGEPLTDIGAPVGHWRKGEWHHVAAAWTGTQMALYIDEQLQATSSNATPPQILGPVFYVGSSPRGDWQADATIDELRISAVARPLAH